MGCGDRKKFVKKVQVTRGVSQLVEILLAGFWAALQKARPPRGKLDFGGRW